jgi:hypothetical protein
MTGFMWSPGGGSLRAMRSPLGEWDSASTSPERIEGRPHSEVASFTHEVGKHVHPVVTAATTARRLWKSRAAFAVPFGGRRMPSTRTNMPTVDKRQETGGVFRTFSQSTHE